MLSNKSLLGKLARLPLRAIRRGAVLRVLSGPLRGAKWVVGSHTHGCWLGTYERTKIREFERSLNDGDVVYDVGANVGVYSLVAARQVGRSGAVFAFEPLPRNLAFLRQHIALNSVENVTIVDAAVGSKSGSAAFEVAAHPAMGRLSHEGIQRVDVVVLDELVTARKIPPPSIMKIDVEGGEVEVLKGAEKTLTARHPVIFLATHGRSIHEQCCRILRDWGYERTPLGGDDID